MDDETRRRPEHLAPESNGGPGSSLNRPLRLGEVLAVTVQLYRDRFWAAVGLGALFGAVVLGVGVVPELIAIPVLAAGITLAWAGATRLVGGDGFGEAWRQVALHLPALAVFTVVASLPFALALSQIFLVVFAVAWLALTGFAIPVAVVEQAPDGLDFIHRLGFALNRSIRLARAEYLHAAGVIAALVIVYLVFGLLLGALLVGFAENTDTAAVALVTVILAPYFFVGLAVLYYEQRARAEGRRPLAHEVP